MLYIANWKMQRSFVQECSLAQEYTDLVSTLQSNGSILVVCPSFPALQPVQTIVSNLPSLALGAQDCSAHITGPYTGQVSAQSLTEVGCSYCIVGHSERRSFETSGQIATKAYQLICNKITPIVCIGETVEQQKQNGTKKALKAQLAPLLALLQGMDKSTPLCIAYEPVWSIGTGNVPAHHYLTDLFAFIQSLCTQAIPSIQPTLLYGGSVNEQTVDSLAAIKGLAGFLIGSASVDVQKLKKIVSLNNKDI